MATVTKRRVDPVSMKLSPRGFGLTMSTRHSAVKGRRQSPRILTQLLVEATSPPSLRPRPATTSPAVI